jgi:hypothetical protein
MLLICLLCVIVDFDHQTIAFQRCIRDPKQSQRARICLGLSFTNWTGGEFFGQDLRLIIIVSNH